MEEDVTMHELSHLLQALLTPITEVRLILNCIVLI
jgi:hypothetical protein